MVKKSCILLGLITFLLGTARGQELTAGSALRPYLHAPMPASQGLEASAAGVDSALSPSTRIAYVSSTARYLRASFEQGWCMPVDDKEIVNNLLRSSRFQNLSIAAAWEVRPTSVYARIYRKPVVGIGFSTLGFRNNQLGNPFMIHGFTEVPLINQERRLHFSYGIGLGISWGFNAFNKDSNPDNEAIGSSINPHLQASFNLGYWLTDKIRLSVGTGFRHFSNGSTKKPNAGINIIPFQIMAQYKIREIRHETYARQLPAFRKHMKYAVMLGGGMKQMGLAEPMIYKFSLNANASYHFSYKYALGLGMDVIYTSGSYQRVPEGSRFQRAISYGPYLGWEWFLTERLYVPIHVGVYLHRNYENDETNGMYQRLGVRYLLLKDRKLSAGAALRSHFGNADFVELSLGWHF